MFANDNVYYLADWSVFEVSPDEHNSEPTLHICGVSMQPPYGGRVSGAVSATPPIVEVEIGTKNKRYIFTTQSGSTYILSGKPGLTLTALNVLSEWMTANEVTASMITDKVPSLTTY